MTTANGPAFSATRQNGGGRPTPHGHAQPNEQPQTHDRAEEGEQWQHDQPREQALVSQASRQPGGVQRSMLTEPGDDSP